MTAFETLMEFEKRFPFLYSIEVNGCPVYTTLRENLLNRTYVDKNGKESRGNKGKIFILRIYDSIRKIQMYNKSKTLIFTSSLYRRDNGRNLAAEFMLDKYPNAVIFEWPCRNEAYDKAYFADPKRKQYCPLDYYVLLYKLYKLIFRRKYDKLFETCKKELILYFQQESNCFHDGEQVIIDYITRELPKNYADITMSQCLFRRLFRKYKEVKYAIDFWGGARENIIPVLKGNPQSIELQHGIIHQEHSGYIYPNIVRNINSSFWNRRLLVYGEGTKRLLTEKSVFDSSQIEVIGNPRVLEYRKYSDEISKTRDFVLFTSQPLEQYGVVEKYYEVIIPILKKIEEYLIINEVPYKLGIKLHPRENNEVQKIYCSHLPNSIVFNNSSELYEVLSRTYVHFTVASTTLFEAALFGCPTVIVDVFSRKWRSNFGFEVWAIERIEEVFRVLDQCMNQKQYCDYLEYLEEETHEYM